MRNAFKVADVLGENLGTGVLGRMQDQLKIKGLQTSANSIAGKGGTMLSGDAQFNNPVFTVSTGKLQSLNNKPTIENLLEEVKVLNGVGDEGNSLLGEHWSSRVASSLFEHELMQEIAAIPEFEVTDYPETTKLSPGFKAIAGHMKSRLYRKVNRDVFYVSDNGEFELVFSFPPWRSLGN